MCLFVSSYNIRRDIQICMWKVFYWPSVEVAFKGVQLEKKNLVTKAKQIEMMRMSRRNLPKNTRHNTDLLWLGRVCLEPAHCWCLIKVSVVFILSEMLKN